MKIRISSIGVELEGGIDNIEDAREVSNLVRDYSETSDGSVSVNNKYHGDIELRFWVKTEELENLFRAIEMLFNSGFQQNNTCGNHIHLKFKKGNRSATREAVYLFSFKNIQEEFIKEYINYSNTRKDKQKYLNRLNNKYCKGNYDRETTILQLICKTKGEYRYRAINLNSFNIHKTLEFRILPYAENAEEYKENVLWLINTVEKLINKYNELHSILDKVTINPDIKLQIINNINIKIEEVKKICVI